MENTLQHEEMNAMKALADTNMKISEAKSTLLKLEATNVAYIEKREQEAIKKVNKIMADSESVIKQAMENYEAVQNLYNTVASFAGFLDEMYLKFSNLVSNFDERGKLWDKNIKEQEKNLAHLQKMIKADQLCIKNDQDGINHKKKLLEVDQIKINDQRGTLERAIERLKNNKI